MVDLQSSLHACLQRVSSLRLQYLGSAMNLRHGLDYLFVHRLFIQISLPCAQTRYRTRCHISFFPQHACSIFSVENCSRGHIRHVAFSSCEWWNVTGLTSDDRTNCLRRPIVDPSQLKQRATMKSERRRGHTTGSYLS